MSSTSSENRRRSRWRTRLIRCVLTIAITWLGLEIGLRVALGDVFPPRFFEPHAQFGHFHVPNRSGWQRSSEYQSYVSINSKGLRDLERAYEKSDGTFRILMLGDSFIEGRQVDQDQTLPAQLEARLNRQSAVPVEVINAGVSRFATDNALLFLEEEGLRYQPDLVIYAFYPNDVVEIQENDLFHLVDGRLVQNRASVSVVDSVRLLLYDHSYLYRFARGLSIRLRHATDASLIQTELGRIHPTYRATLRPEEIDTWKVIARLLERMVGAASEHGARVVVVCLPEDFQSRDALWEQIERSDEVLRRDGPNRMLAEAVPAGVPYFDLLPDFRAAASEQELYYPIDHHFNAEGQALAAGLIEGFLTAEGLIPTLEGAR